MLTPAEGLAEPRLWVRRLRIWQDFDDDDPSRGRTIEFKRGLNIVASPPARNRERLSTGHAAGKTLLCRQLRYCLGEDRFADSEDTTAVRKAFPNGGVGAEIRLRGETWVVRRAFSSKADDRAAKGARLEELAADMYRDTYGAFRATLQGVAFSDSRRVLLEKFDEIDVPWHYVLAWLTRDQECRLEGLTHWRHSDSRSQSLVRKTSIETRLNILRIVLGLYSERSTVLHRQVIDAERNVSFATQTARRREERINMLRSELATALQLDETEIWPPPSEALQTAESAQETHFRRLGKLVDQKIRATHVVERTSEQEATERELEETQGELVKIEREIEAAIEHLEPFKEQLVLLWNNSTENWKKVRDASNPRCPYDGTRIDVDQAKFVCPLPRLPDPVAAKLLAQETDAHRRRIADEISNQEERIAQLQGRQELLNRRIKNLENRIEAYQLAVNQASEESQAAWAAKSTLRNFIAAVNDLEDARSVERSATDALESFRALRNADLTSYSREPLTTWFNVLVKRVVSSEATGEVTLDGNGLHANVYWRGRRRSVALNSLRVVLFDLAAMLCAVEGKSSAPAFLVHDSPREGDLDPYTYERLFEAVFELAPDNDSAPLQYIVTTTTAPPDRVRSCIREELSAESPETRLFRVDL